MKTCPICGKKKERLLALSRADNKTMICDECGVAEALLDFLSNMREERDGYDESNS